MNYGDIHNRLTALKRITKYGIIMLAVLLTIHCGLLTFGYDLFVVHALACVYALWLGLSLSRVYGLCWAHRLCVIYICVVLSFIVFKRHDIFDMLGLDIKAWRMAMFISGVIIIGNVIWRAIRTN